MSSSPERVKSIRAKYLRLDAGELFAGVLFLYLAFSKLPTMSGEARLSLGAALIPLLVVLLQAGGY